MIRYKINVMQALAEKGYPSVRMRKEKIFGENTMQRFRKGEQVALTSLNTVCIILDCKLEDIVELVPTQEERDAIFKNTKKGVDKEEELC